MVPDTAAHNPLPGLGPKAALERMHSSPEHNGLGWGGGGGGWGGEQGLVGYP